MNVLTKKDIMIGLKSIKHTITSYFFGFPIEYLG